MNESSTLLELIPPMDLQRHQVAVTQYGVLPTYRMARTPRSLHELAPYHGDEIVVAMDNNRTLLLFQSLDVFSEMLYLPHIPYSKCLLLYYHWADGTVTNCQMVGDTESSLLDTALLLARLPAAEETEMSQIMMRCFNFNCNASHSEKVTALLDAFPNKKIRVVHSRLNDVLSAALASRPYSIDFSLLMASMDVGAFTKQLKARTTTTTTFGSFGMAGSEQDDDYEDVLRRLFPHLPIFEKFHISDVPGNDLVLQLLSAPLKSIAFSTGRDTGRMVLPTNLAIVPTDICVMIDTQNGVFPTQFLTSFLQQLAQSNNLERFGFRLMEEHAVPAEVTRALCHALAASTKLNKLELTGCTDAFGNGLPTVLAALEQHESLRTLRIVPYPTELDPDLTWIKRLLRRNRNIEVIDLPEEADDDEEMEEIYAVTRFFHGSKSLTGESALTRRFLMNAALTENAEGDLERTGLLSNDHMDILYEQLQETDFLRC